MKKILLTAVTFIALGAGSAFAQFGAGNWLISGGIGVSTTSGETTLGTNPSVDSPKITNISFLPTAGYFLKERLAIGAGLNLTSNTNNDEANKSEVKLSGFGLSPFARYYYPLNDKFSLFSQGTISFYTETETDESTTGTVTTKDEVKTNAFGLSAGLGLTYFVSSRIALETTLGGIGFSTASSEGETNGTKTGESTQNEFGLNATNRFTTGGFNISFVYFWGK